MKALLTMLALAGAQPAQQFDLVCTGAVTPYHEGVFLPTNVHLRVDLAAKRWCEGDCAVIHDIADVQPNAIWFEKQTDTEKLQQLEHWRAVDRETGTYNQVVESISIGTRNRAAFESHCERAAFSGFPRLTTKF